MKNLLTRRESESDYWWQKTKRETEEAERRYKERKQQELNLREQARP
jgi:hypothetical protein